MTFEYPIAFTLLIVYFVCSRFCKQKGLAIYFPNMALLQQASVKKRVGLQAVKLLTILSLVVALASPIKQDDIVLRNDQGYEISLILDASGSMEQSGKFAIVRDIVASFIDQRENDKLALSIFADFAYVAVPLTYDKKSIKRLLKRLGVGVVGTSRTALYEALFLSSNLFKTSKAKEKIAILLTDGVDNTESIPIEVAINTAKKYGIKVYTVGVGNAGDFNPEVLNKIAEQTDGKYFSANTVEGLEKIYTTINELEKSDIEANKLVKNSYYFQYILAFSLLCLVSFFYMVNKE